MFECEAFLGNMLKLIQCMRRKIKDGNVCLVVGIRYDLDGQVHIYFLVDVAFDSIHHSKHEPALPIY